MKGEMQMGMDESPNGLSSETVRTLVVFRGTETLVSGEPRGKNNKEIDWESFIEADDSLDEPGSLADQPFDSDQ